MSEDDEERQPEEELSDCRSGSEDSARQRIAAAKLKEDNKIEQMTELLQRSNERNSDMKEDLKKMEEWKEKVDKTAQLHHDMLTSLSQQLETQGVAMKNMEMTMMTAVGGLQAAIEALVKKTTDTREHDPETIAKVRRVGD